MASADMERSRVRKPVGPKGNQDQKTEIAAASQHEGDKRGKKSWIGSLTSSI